MQTDSKKVKEISLSGNQVTNLRDANKQLGYVETSIHKERLILLNIIL